MTNVQKTYNVDSLNEATEILTKRFITHATDENADQDGSNVAILIGVTQNPNEDKSGKDMALKFCVNGTEEGAREALIKTFERDKTWLNIVKNALVDYISNTNPAAKALADALTLRSKS
jgi:hypothetical protein